MIYYAHPYDDKIQLADELLLMISTIITYLEIVYIADEECENSSECLDRGYELYAAREVWKLGNVISSARDLGFGHNNADWMECVQDLRQVLESYKSLPLRVMRPGSKFRQAKMMKSNKIAIGLARRLETLISKAQDKFRNSKDEKVQRTAPSPHRSLNVADTFYVNQREPYIMMWSLLRGNHDPYARNFMPREPAPDFDDAVLHCKFRLS